MIGCSADKMIRIRWGNTITLSSNKQNFKFPAVYTNNSFSHPHTEFIGHLSMKVHRVWSPKEKE